MENAAKFQNIAAFYQNYTIKKWKIRTRLDIIYLKKTPLQVE